MKDNNQTPKVSVLMPIYNTTHQYLKEAIESILEQTFKDFELIIINDASPDESLDAIVRSYNDDRIKYYKNEKNLGISQTRNKLINLARGEYLAVFDHDDISLPNRLEKQVAFLDENHKVGVLGSWFKIIGSDKVFKLPTESAAIKKNMFIGNCLCHPATMIRKAVLTENNLYYEEKYSPAEDYSLWGRLIDKTEFANLPEVLFDYRYHEASCSHQRLPILMDADAKIKAFMRHDAFEMWAATQKDMVEVKRFKLCGILPILVMKRTPQKTKWLLFGKIPLITITKKDVISI